MESSGCVIERKGATLGFTILVIIIIITKAIQRTVRQDKTVTKLGGTEGIYHNSKSPYERSSWMAPPFHKGDLPTKVDDDTMKEPPANGVLIFVIIERFVAPIAQSNTI